MAGKDENINTFSAHGQQEATGMATRTTNCSADTKHQPCPTCPWRKSSTVGGGDIPNFDLGLMRRLSNTVGEGDAFRPIMACHYSPCGGEHVCNGYAAIEGYSNLNVRMLASRGVIPLKAIWDACEGLDLWPSFKKMLAAYVKAAKEAPRPRQPQG